MTETYTTNQSSNAGSFIEARIKNDDLLLQIRNYLSGKVTQAVRLDDGQIILQEIQLGESHCNELGVAGIMSSIMMRANPSTVQGNFMRDDYEDYKYYTRIELTKSIVKNAPKWGIKDDKIEKIIDDVMGLLIPFISRLIGNKERESYNQFQSREVIQNDSKGMNILNRGNN